MRTAVLFSMLMYTAAISITALPQTTTTTTITQEDIIVYHQVDADQITPDYGHWNDISYEDENVYDHEYYYIQETITETVEIEESDADVNVEPLRPGPSRLQLPKFHFATGDDDFLSNISEDETIQFEWFNEVFQDS